MLKDENNSSIYSIIIIIFSVICIITSIIITLNSIKGISIPYATDVLTFMLGSISFINGLKNYNKKITRKYSYVFFIIGLLLLVLSIYSFVSK